MSAKDANKQNSPIRQPESPKQHVEQIIQQMDPDPNLEWNIPSNHEYEKYKENYVNTTGYGGIKVGLQNYTLQKVVHYLQRQVNDLSAAYQSSVQQNDTLIDEMKKNLVTT